MAWYARGTCTECEPGYCYDVDEGPFETWLEAASESLRLEAEADGAPFDYWVVERQD